MPEVSAHVLAMARQLREGARRSGWVIYGGEAEERAITSLVEPAAGWEKVKNRMEAAKIRVSWRKEHGGVMLLRVAPHLGNTPAEIEEFLSVLKS